MLSQINTSGVSEMMGILATQRSRTGRSIDAEASLRLETNRLAIQVRVCDEALLALHCFLWFGKRSLVCLEQCGTAID